MKNLIIATITLSLSVAGMYAGDGSVRMTLSGTAAPSTITLRSDTSAFEYSFAGNGTLGRFTFRTVSASEPAPQDSSACPSPKLYFPTFNGAGVFRFDDGSLLSVNLTGGSDCIDLSGPQALCIRIFQITGGTGRLQSASGTLTVTETVVPVLGDASNNPALLAITGKVSGTVSGLGNQEEFRIPESQ